MYLLESTFDGVVLAMCFYIFAVLVNYCSESMKGRLGGASNIVKRPPTALSIYEQKYISPNIHGLKQQCTCKNDITLGV